MKNAGKRTILLLIAALGFGGLLLVMTGNDAVTEASQKKDSLLIADQINVSFEQVGGKIISISTREGDVVSKGAVLMELDPTDTDLQIERINAQISAMDIQIKQAEKGAGDQEVSRQQEAVALAKETLDFTSTNYERVKALYEAGACAKSVFEEAQMKLTAAQNAVNQSLELLERAQSTYESAQLNIPSLHEQKKVLQVQLDSCLEQKRRLTLKAPSDGCVVRVVPKEGENISPGTPVVLLQSSDLYFDLYVPETQVSDFQVGMSLPVNVIALDQTFQGEVRFINSAPQYTSMRMSRDSGQGDLSIFQIRIYMKGSQEGLLPGMSVEVKNVPD